MKTFNKLYLSLILLSSSLFSVEKSYSFIGIQTGGSSIKKEFVPKIGLRYGIQTRKFRTTLSYDYAKKSNNKYQTLIMQMDTGIFSSIFRNSLIKPYAGVSIGVMQEDDLHCSCTDRGYVYGLNTGLAYIFNDNLDFDLGYRYLETSKIKDIASLSDLSLSMHYFY